jgi:hypothetical protein
MSGTLSGLHRVARARPCAPNALREHASKASTKVEHAFSSFPLVVCAPQRLLCLAPRHRHSHGLGTRLRFPTGPRHQRKGAPECFDDPLELCTLAAAARMPLEPRALSGRAAISS